MSDPNGSRPASRVVLHIGLLGAGGAHVRSILAAHREAVSGAGVHVAEVDEEAVREAVAPRRDAAEPTGAWQRLVEAVDAAAEPVRLVSAEVLSTAPDNAARAIVASFGPHQVDVVVTAQDLARTVPSAWQHSVANGRKITFTEYASAATGAANDRPTREQLTRQQDLAAILQRWSGIVGAGNVHLVTLPPPGAPGRVLWERFARAIGLAPDVAPLDDMGDYVDGQPTFSETELLRRLNRRVGEEFGSANYDRYLRDFLAGELMRPLGEAAPEDRPALDAKGRQWATKRGQQVVADVAGLGVDVVGDLADLVPSVGGPASNGDGSTPLATYPDSAVRAVAMLLRKLVEIDPAAAPTPEKSPQRRRGLRAVGRGGSRRAGS